MAVASWAVPWLSIPISPGRDNEVELVRPIGLGLEALAVVLGVLVGVVLAVAWTVAWQQGHMKFLSRLSLGSGVTSTGHNVRSEEALDRFGHDVSFEECRAQIGKGGDQLIPVFLSEAEQKDHGAEMKKWRGERFKSKYLSLVRPSSAVPELLQRVHDAGWKVAVASSAKTTELETYLEIAAVRDLIDVQMSSEDAEQSKPALDILKATLKKLGLGSADAVAIGDTPYDAEAAGKAGISTIGILCGGFSEIELRNGGCVAVYPGPATLLACFDSSMLAQKHLTR